MSCGVGLRCSLDLALLWLWCKPAATAPIRPLDCEPLYAEGAPPPRKKKKEVEEVSVTEEELRGGGRGRLQRTAGASLEQRLHCGCLDSRQQGCL